MVMMLNRRQFLATLSLIGAAGLFRTPRAVAADGPPETTAIRLARSPTICVAPQYVAEEMLRAEGFTDLRYVDTLAPDVPQAVARGKVDFSLAYASQFVATIDAGEPVTLLAGVMVGCFELFAKEGIHSIAELKGKTVGVQALGSTPHVLLTVLAAHLGLDPVNDIHWVTDPNVKPIELFVQGKIDAFLGFPPEPQDLRTRHIGHVLVNTAMDRPWSQYFCCLLAGNPEFVRKYPIATKRVLRAVLKLPTSVPPIRPAPHSGWSMAVSPLATIMPCRQCASCLTTSGASTTPRTRSDSTLCACTKQASSNRPRRRLLPTVRIGAF
jgi:NitT/TauT family transport system substrate-binding protein